MLPSLRRQNGPIGVGRQTLFHRNRGDGELSKAVETSIGGNPDIALAVLEKAEDKIA